MSFPATEPSHDRYETHLVAGHPDHVPDPDTGRPVELFGVGFRNGFDAVTYDQSALFGSSATGERNACAVSWATNGLSVGTRPQACLTSRWPHQASRSYLLETTEDWQGWQSVPAPNLALPRVGPRGLDRRRVARGRAQLVALLPRPRQATIVFSPNIFGGLLILLTVSGWFMLDGRQGALQDGMPICGVEVWKDPREVTLITGVMQVSGELR